MSRARHPSFSSQQAATLVRTLSRRQLRRLWAESSAQLAQPLPDLTRLHLVLLREQLLCRAEELDPRAIRHTALGQLREPRRRPEGREGT